MISDNDRGIFAPDEWKMVQGHLTTACKVMQNLGKKYRLRFYEGVPYHGGGLWPTVGLQMRWRLFKIVNLEISLNWHYFLQDPRIFYILHEDDINNWTKAPSQRTIRNYSVQDVQDAELIRRDVEELIVHRTKSGKVRPAHG
jgi:hypothetical protein